MTTKPLQTPKYYARLIVDYLKQQPDMAVDDPLKVRDALELSNPAFKAGVDWCLARKIIVLEKPLDLENEAPQKEGKSSFEEAAMQGAASKLSSMLKQPVAVEA
jgi:hypothetical protein